MFRIFENNFSKRQIKVNLNEFEEGIQFALKNKCDGFNLASGVGKEKIIIDLSLFNQLSDSLTFLSIDSYVKLEEHKNVESLYLLKNLEKIVWGKQKLKFDFSNFSKLKQIALDYTKSAVNFDKLTFLDILVISYYDEENLETLSEMPALKILHIYQSKIINLKGIDRMKNLEELNLNRNKSLNNISNIKNLHKLRKLHIEKCKNLNDFSTLKGNASIKELLISELDSVSFVREMNVLEEITFWDLKDGDLTPLLKAPSLKEVSFNPNRKHYSHTNAEVNHLLTNNSRKYSD